MQPDNNVGLRVKYKIKSFPKYNYNQKEAKVNLKEIFFNQSMTGSDYNLRFDHISSAGNADGHSRSKYHHIPLVNQSLLDARLRGIVKELKYLILFFQQYWRHSPGHVQLPCHLF